MENIVESLAKGIVFNADLNLQSDIEALSCDLYAKRKYEDNIVVYANKPTDFEYRVVSTNYRVNIKSTILSDQKLNISFYIDTRFLDQNDKIDGYIRVYTTIGSKDIHYTYNIIEDSEDLLLKKITDINSYYNLFNTNFDFSFNIFNDSRFYQTDLLKDEKTLCYYEAIKKGVNKNIAIIEFFACFGLDIKPLFANKNDSLLNEYLSGNKNNVQYNEENNKSYKNNELYDIINKINDKDLIDMVAISLIRRGYHDDIAFNIYMKTLSYGSTINNLYKMILLSLPENLDTKLPLYVYRYFFEDKTFTFEQKTLLYNHIINCFNESDDIYKMFYDEICQYALSEIYKNKISENLLSIYKKIINQNIITEANATNILYLLRNYKLTLKNKDIKYVIIKYVETNNETKYSVENGVVFLPIFFESKVLLFEDKNGLILYNVDYELNAIFDNPELEKEAIKVSKNKNIYLFSKYFDIINQENLSEIDVNTAFEIIENLNLSHTSTYKLINKILDSLLINSINNNQLSYNRINFLKDVDYYYLGTSNKKKILKIMLDNKEVEYVFDKISQYDINLLLDEDKIKFFLLYYDKYKDNLSKDYKRLLYDFVTTSNLDNYPNDLLKLLIDDDYVYNHNDNILLNIVIKQKIPVNNFIESMLVFMLNYDQNENIDFVYNIYDINFTDFNNIKKAYLTKKSYNYFYGIDEINNIFIESLSKYLSNNLFDIDNIPILYLLAFTLYASTLNIITNNEYRRILIVAIDYLIKKDLVFSYFKKLNKHINIDNAIMNKEYIEFISKPGIIPKLKININNNDQDVELINIYNNIYQRSLHIYKNEFITYKIYNQNKIDDGVLKEGSISYNKLINNNQNLETYDAINEIINNFADNKLSDLKLNLVDLEVKEEITKNLFNI